MAHLLLRGVPLGPPGWELEAVLFDKDGTMSHSEPMLEGLAQERLHLCLQLAMPHLGTSAEAAEHLHDLLCRAYGLRTGRIDPAGITAVASRDHNLIATATTLTQVGLGWPDALAISEEVFARTDALHGQGTGHRPMPTAGLIPLLEALRQEGIACAVISNDHETGIREFLAAHGIQDHVQGLWSADHRPAKPDPRAVHALCAALGVEPGRCALVGDADSDLRMAQGAGVPVVLGYRGGWREPPVLREQGHRLAHWTDLQLVGGPAPPGVHGHPAG